MKTIDKSIRLIVIFVILFFNISFSQTPPNIEVIKLKENFYRLTSTIPYPANFLAYVCKDSILLVDAGQEQTGVEIKEALQNIAIGNANVKMLINTHAHIDHTGGNLSLAGQPLITGSENLKPTLRNYSYVLYEFPDNALPSITFKDSMNINFGDEKIKIISVPGSHDATDAIVHFIKAGIVCLGDISYGMTFPSIDGYTGNLLKYPEVIEKVLALIPNNVTIVSGHGKETSVEELKQFRNMIVNTTRIIKEGLAKGKDIATMQKEDILKDWASYEGGIGGDRKDWIEALANAGPSKLRNSLAGELYKVLITNDVDGAIIRYQELKKNNPTEYPFSDNQLIRTGNWLLSKERINEARKLFEFCINEYPNSSNSYEKFADTYLKTNNKELAIKNYQKSLQLNPNNKNVEEKLKQVLDKK